MKVILPRICGAALIAAILSLLSLALAAAGTVRLQYMFAFFGTILGNAHNPSALTGCLGVFVTWWVLSFVVLQVLAMLWKRKK